jgi:hypothetical protein
MAQSFVNISTAKGAREDGLIWMLQRRQRILKVWVSIAHARKNSHLDPQHKSQKQDLIRSVWLGHAILKRDSGSGVILQQRMSSFV